MKKIISGFKYEYVVLCTISLCCTLFIYFSQSDEVCRVFENWNTTFRYSLFRFIAFILLFIIFYFALNYIRNLFCNDKIKRRISFFFVLYFLVNCIFLLVTWPGIIKGDEFYVIPSLVSKFSVVWNQSFFTSVFYLLALCIFPYLVGITFLQVIIISFIATDIFKKVDKYLNYLNFSYFIFAPFLLLPVIDNNLFTLRSSLISWILTDIFVEIVISYKCNGIYKFKTWIKIIFWCIIIAVWKMEFCIVILEISLLAILILVLKKISLKRCIAILISVVICYLAVSTTINSKKPQSNYIMTSVLTPFSIVITKHYDDIQKNENLSKDFMIIDSITPIDDIIECTLGTNIPPTYWGYDNFDTDTLRIWMKSTIKICGYYWKDFMENRFYVFIYTNGMISNVINHTGYESIESIFDLKYYQISSIEDFFWEHFDLMTPPLGFELRTKTMSFIGCRDFDDYKNTNILYPLMYNSLIPLCFIIFHLIYSVKKHFFIESFVDLCLSIILLVVLILAPAVFWMYYMPFYLSSYTLLTMYLLSFFNKRIKNASNNK